ncbi:MAG TPA: hypothetical protein VKV06_02770 [Acidimicrobiales bacterium]|nr:hypothetical protein [Acidimicrobiales bacterium]
MATAARLAGLAIVLAGPVASRLARSEWLAASPRAAIVRWQALG